MNTAILKECLTALQADHPDISYIRGMLKTLVMMSESSLGEKSEVPRASHGFNLGKHIMPNSGSSTHKVENQEMTDEEKAVAESMGLIIPGFQPNPGVMEQNTILNA